MTSLGRLGPQNLTRGSVPGPYEDTMSHHAHRLVRTPRNSHSAEYRTGDQQTPVAEADHSRARQQPS
eukprot:4072359-Amphidinium_carterae.2